MTKNGRIRNLESGIEEPQEQKNTMCQDITRIVPCLFIDMVYSTGPKLFTWYNFVACDMLATSLRHESILVNQTYNLLAIVVYDMTNVVGF